MTNPRPEMLEREKDKLYLTDAELIRRLGVPEKVVRPILPTLENKHPEAGLAGRPTLQRGGSWL